MSEISQLQAMLKSPVNSALHLFGLRETKHKCFQMPFGKDNMSNGVGGIIVIVYVQNGINAKRRDDLETNDIQFVWFEITPDWKKSFLIGNMFRPPNSKANLMTSLKISLMML